MIRGIPLIDIAAFGAFLALWVGYTALAEHRTMLGRSLSAVMTRHRRVWMRAFCDRENRVADGTFVSALMRSVSFFASTSILALGGLVALMGAGEHAFIVYKELPFAGDSGLEAFEMKVLLLAVIFVYAFFQFTWSLRQFNYCCILMGAAPLPSAEDSVKESFATHSARLQSLAANSFNRGLRAHYFALAMILWFVDTWAFLAAGALVIGVLYRREFRSKSLSTLADGLEGQ
jgi:Predicted membrane protein